MESQPNAIRTSIHTGNGHVLEVVREAHEELRHLLQQRAEVMRRIGTIKQTIAGLANLYGDEVLSEELLELIDRKSSGRRIRLHQSVPHDFDGCESLLERPWRM